MRDRFDLEQDIMNCWNVVDDIRLLLRQNAVNNDTLEAVAVLYQQKFEGLFSTFEDCCTQAMLGKTKYDYDTASRQTYGVEEEYDTVNDIGFPEPEENFEKRQDEEIKNSWSA